MSWFKKVRNQVVVYDTQPDDMDVLLGSLEVEFNVRGEKFILVRRQEPKPNAVRRFLNLVKRVYGKLWSR